MKTPIPFNEKCFFPPKNIYIYKEWAGCPHNSADWKSSPADWNFNPADWNFNPADWNFNPAD